MKVKYEDRLKQKIIAITKDTLVVGVDIAKNYQWARFVGFRGMEHDHALEFKNSKGGFETILARIREICKEENFFEFPHFFRELIWGSIKNAKTLNLCYN